MTPEQVLRYSKLMTELSVEEKQKLIKMNPINFAPYLEFEGQNFDLLIHDVI